MLVRNFVEQLTKISDTKMHQTIAEIQEGKP